MSNILKYGKYTLFVATCVAFIVFVPEIVQIHIT